MKPEVFFISPGFLKLYPVGFMCYLASGGQVLTQELITHLLSLICTMLRPSNCLVFYYQVSGVQSADVTRAYLSNVCVARELLRNGLGYALLEKSKLVAHNWGKKQSTIYNCHMDIAILISLPLQIKQLVLDCVDLVLLGF